MTIADRQKIVRRIMDYIRQETDEMSQHDLEMLVTDLDSQLGRLALEHCKPGHTHDMVTA